METEVVVGKHSFFPAGATVDWLSKVSAGLAGLFLHRGPCTLAVGEPNGQQVSEVRASVRVPVSKSLAGVAEGTACACCRAVTFVVRSRLQRSKTWSLLSCEKAMLLTAVERYRSEAAATWQACSGARKVDARAAACFMR